LQSQIKIYTLGGFYYLHKKHRGKTCYYEILIAEYKVGKRKSSFTLRINP
jgi:hypothetical protein